MIGTEYASGLPAEPAETPDGQCASSFTGRCTDDRDCKTTLFDVGRRFEETHTGVEPD